MAWEPAKHFVYDDLIREVADRHNIDWLLVKAQVAAESSFDPKAFRKEPGPPEQGSYGLLQVLWTTATGDLGYRGRPEGLFDPRTNLELGVKYLQRLLRVFGDWRLARAAYNAGPGRVRQLQRKHGYAWRQVEPHLPSITRAYVKRIEQYREEFVAYEQSRARKA